MKQFLCCFLIILALALLSFSQEDVLANKDIAKVQESEYRNSEIMDADLDWFANLVSSDPNYIGYIIVYRGIDDPPGTNIRIGTRLLKYLSLNRGLDPARCKFINGGIRQKLSYEFWVAKPNVPQPNPTTIIQEKIDESQAFLFDEFYHPLPDKDWGGCCGVDGYKKEEAEASLDKYAEKLKANLSFKAYLIAYAQYCKDCLGSGAVLDSFQTAAIMLKREKDYLIKHHKIPASRIITTNGGHRKWQEVELWLVPENGEKPKPKPTTFPPKRKKKRK